MTLWLGDLAVDSVVSLPFSTHEAAGGNVAPSSAFEIADIRVYKGASATQRSSSSGMTMTSPFDSMTGVHMVEIDTSDDTDTGFFAAGNLYHVMLAPDETVDSQTLTGVHLASFGIEYSAIHSLLSTVLSRLGSPSNLGGGASVAGNLSDIYDVADSVSSNVGAAGAGLTAITDLIGTPTNLGSGATVAGNLVDIEAQTDDIGAAGAGLTAVPWNAAWDAEVQSEATDALNAYDTPTNTEMVAAFTEIKGATWSSTTDTLEHIRDKQTDIETDTQDLQTQIGTDGAGLTAIGDTRLANLDATVSSRLATAGYTAPLDAAGIRTAVGMSTNNLDTQLAALPTDADVQTAAAAALTAYDPPTKAELDSGFAGLNDPTAAAVADAVWDEAIAGHAGAGSTGEALAAAGSAGDPWATALPGAYGSGTAGKIIGDNINATVSSRASQTSVDDLPTNAELASALASADDATLAAIGALNNLSSAQAQTAATAALNAYDPPTNAEMVARTLVAASYFDPAADTVANVTTVATTTNLTNLPAAAALEATAQAILEDTGTTLPGTLATIAGYIDTEVAAILAAVDTEVAAILADTNELQTNQGNWVTADVSALATAAELAKVPKSDGSASWNATALAAINAQADTALADYDAPTKTEMDAAFTVIKGATWDSATDTLEALRDRGDAAWTTADVSDLPTNSELATALASADDAMLTAIADVPTVAEFEARTLVAASYATAANLATLSGYVDTEVAAILADTNELQTDLTNGGRLDLLIDAIKAKTDNLPAAPAATGDIPSAATIADAVLDEAVVGHVIAGSFSKAVVDILDDTSTSLPLAIASITPQSAADIRAEMDTNSTKLAAILADTNELQTDWANGGRLDLILDARASQTSVDDMPTNSELATALSGITASVDQQDIADALLLAPSGAAASGSAMDYLADILEDTGTTLPTAIADLPTAAEIDTELSGTHGDGSWEGEAAAGGGTGYYTDTVTDGASPLDGVQVQLYTAQDRVGLAYEAYTNALGVFEMWPDPGTYYRWLDLAGYSFTQDVEVEVTEP